MNRINASSPAWLNKVPEVTLTFWLIKMMSTTVGETAADFLNVNLGFGLTGTSAVMGLLLAIFLGLQINARRYIPWRYWSTVVFVSVFGTLVTDNLSDNLGVPLAVSTLAFSAALLATFGIWYAKERTLSIHSIDTIKRAFLLDRNFAHLRTRHGSGRLGGRRSESWVRELRFDVRCADRPGCHCEICVSAKRCHHVLDRLYPDSPVRRLVW